jgi:hypothetical protein
VLSYISCCQLQRVSAITGLIMPESIQLSSVSRLAIVVAALDAGHQTHEHFPKCFVVLSHARLWISNGYPASVIAKN